MSSTLIRDDSVVCLNNVQLTLKSQAGPVPILRNLDLSIRSGQKVGLVGPSGSGKSSLMMLIAGLERPTSGEIDVIGAKLTTLNEEALAQFRRDNIGIVFQSFHLIPTMTVLENVALPLEFAGRKDAFSASEKVLEGVGLSHRLHHYPSQLSGGEQQRVALARAMGIEPTLILADEPTGNLDAQTGDLVMTLLFELVERRHATLIVITHDVALVERCDRLVRMLDGRITQDSEAKMTTT